MNKVERMSRCARVSPDEDVALCKFANDSNYINDPDARGPVLDELAPVCVRVIAVSPRRVTANIETQE